MENTSRIIIPLLILLASVFYVLADIPVNPFILWTALPLYIGYFQMRSAIRQQSYAKLYACCGFIMLSASVSLLYHLAWYFDWQGTRTGDSTSALIFIFFPLYSVLFGYIGYVTGLLVGKYIRISGES
jgi:hypothetical protein